MPAKELELAELTSRSSDPGLWDDPAAAQVVLRRADELREEIGAWQDLGARATALAEMAELAAAEPDGGATMAADLERDLAGLSADWNRMEGRLLLSEPYDERPAIVSVHAGAGGTESQDWAEMLLRMYLRWAERNKYRTEILDQTEGEEAGLKSVTVGDRRPLGLRAAAERAGRASAGPDQPVRLAEPAPHQLRAGRGDAGGPRGRGDRDRRETT